MKHRIELEELRFRADYQGGTIAALSLKEAAHKLKHDDVQSTPILAATIVGWASVDMLALKWKTYSTTT